MVRTSGPGPGTRAFVDWTLRHGKLLWLLALALAVPSVLRTVSLYQHLKSDIEELLPRDAPSVRALVEMRARLPGLQYLGVVVDTDRPENLPAGERLLDDLAARIRAYPHVRSSATYAPGNETERHLRTSTTRPSTWTSPIRSEVSATNRSSTRRPRVAARVGGPPRRLRPPALPRRRRPRKEIRPASFLACEGWLRVAGRPLLRRQRNISHCSSSKPGEFTTGARTSTRPSPAACKPTFAELGGPGAYAPGMRVGFCSDVAISVEELDALEADLSLSSVLVGIAEILVIVIYYRWWRSVFVLFPPLLLATAYAFEIASLPPGNVTALTSNTAFLGSIIVGNGINVGIVLLARYREARHAGASVDEALVRGVWGAKLGTLAAALAAAVSYASLIVTEFRGFRQFGYIGGAGMVASWVTAFVLMPPLIRWLDRDEPLARSTRGSRVSVMGLVVSFVERWPVPAVGVQQLHPSRSAPSSLVFCTFRPCPPRSNMTSRSSGGSTPGKTATATGARRSTRSSGATRRRPSSSRTRPRPRRPPSRSSVTRSTTACSSPWSRRSAASDDVLPAPSRRQARRRAPDPASLSPPRSGRSSTNGAAAKTDLDKFLGPEDLAAARRRGPAPERSRPASARRTGPSAAPSSFTRARRTRSGGPRRSTRSSAPSATPAPRASRPVSPPAASPAPSPSRETSSPRSAATPPSPASSRSRARWRSSSSSLRGRLASAST